jgi:hypothetical protein
MQAAASSMRTAEAAHLPDCYYATTGNYWAITPQPCSCFNSSELQTKAVDEDIKCSKIKLKWSGKDWVFVGVK